MIFPIGDTNIVGGSKPYFSYTFILLNILVFLIQISIPGNLVCDWAAIPERIIQGQGLYTMITSMFMHASWMHLIGNMIFLWIFADNIEAVIGNYRFVVFYFLGGLVASGLHIGVETIFMGNDPFDCCKPCIYGLGCSTEMKACAGFVPSLGASGAIAAVLGSYIMWFPKSRIKMFALFFTFYIPAGLFLGFWFLEQLFSGVGALGILGQKGGVAWWAHIGGFVFGLLYGWKHRDAVRRSIVEY